MPYEGSIKVSDLRQEITYVMGSPSHLLSLEWIAEGLTGHLKPSRPLHFVDAVMLDLADPASEYNKSLLRNGADNLILVPYCDHDLNEAMFDISEKLAGYRLVFVFLRLRSLETVTLRKHMSITVNLTEYVTDEALEHMQRCFEVVGRKRFHKPLLYDFNRERFPIPSVLVIQAGIKTVAAMLKLIREQPTLLANYPGKICVLADSCERLYSLNVLRSELDHLKLRGGVTYAVC